MTCPASSTPSNPRDDEASTRSRAAQDQPTDPLAAQRRVARRYAIRATEGLGRFKPREPRAYVATEEPGAWPSGSGALRATGSSPRPRLLAGLRPAQPSAASQPDLVARQGGAVRALRPCSTLPELWPNGPERGRCRSPIELTFSLSDLTSQSNRCSIMSSTLNASSVTGVAMPGPASSNRCVL
jgi:hypothetical protein